MIPKAVIVADLGSSGFKLIYLSAHGKPSVVMMPPESGLVDAAHIDQRLQSYHDDPQRSAYVTTEKGVYAVGEFARDAHVVQYHEFSKWHDLTLKVMAILGLVKELTGAPNSFSASLGLLLPRAEATMNDRNERINEIKRAAAAGFSFRNDAEPVRCDLELTLFTEGSGMFFCHSAAMRSQGQFSSKMDVPILMGGERNTSLTYFERGRLSPKRSNSNGPHFYEVAESVRKTIGADVPLHSLISAIARGQSQFRYPGLMSIDISGATEKGLDTYYQNMTRYLKAQMPVEKVSVCGCGGALWLIWERLQSWFEDELRIPAVYLNPALQADLKNILASDMNFDLIRNPADPLRFADAYGVYQVLLSQARQVAQATPSQLVA